MHSPYSPTEHHGEVLVVFEGRRRLTWTGPDNGTATVSSLWPDPVQRGDVQRHLARQAPLLVVIDHDTGPVPLLPEEAPALPPEVKDLLEDDAGFPVLRIPLLNWLPAPLRHRGTAFMTAVDAQRGSTPGPLLPDLVADRDTGQPVRFVRRVTPRPISPWDLGEAIRLLFVREPLLTGPTT